MANETTIVEGGGTAGLREAALAKRAAKPAAPAAPKPNTQEPTFEKHATPAADSLRKQAPKEPAPEFSDDDFPELTSFAEPESSEPAEETIKIGDHEIPVSVLEQLPDEALRRIKRKIKAGGEDLEITLAEALADVPKARGWQKRMWEAAQVEKRAAEREEEVRRVARQLGTDTVGAIAHIYGVSRSRAAEHLSQQALDAFAQEDLTPEQKADLAQRERDRAAAAELEQYKQREAEQAQKAEQAQYRARALADMKPMLAAEGLSHDELTVARVAMCVDAGLRDGIITQIGPDELRWAAGEVRKERDRELDAELPMNDGAAIAKRLGPERARAVARWYAAEVQRMRQPVQRAAPPNGQPRASKSEPQKPRTWREWKEQADKDARRRDRARGIR